MAFYGMFHVAQGNFRLYITANRKICLVLHKTLANIGLYLNISQK